MAQQAMHRRKLREKRHLPKAHLTSHSTPVSDASESDAAEDSDLRYFVSPSLNEKKDIYWLLKSHSDDPAYKVCIYFKPYTFSICLICFAWQDFLPKLQDHLLGRLLEREFDGDTHETFTPADRQSVRILGGKMYSVNTCRLYYTTYDVQRQTDTINPKTCPDVMMYASDADHERYWYARVLGIYHTKVWTTHPGVKNGSDVRRMDFLWVRWLGTEPGYKQWTWLPEGETPKNRICSINRWLCIWICRSQACHPLLPFDSRVFNRSDGGPASKSKQWSTPLPTTWRKWDRRLDQLLR